MPTVIHPMLASVTEKPFDDPNWFFEIKWDGYRAVAFFEEGKVRLVSRNQNDLTPRYPELKVLGDRSRRKPPFWMARLSFSMNKAAHHSA